jgi:hypothetical protein
VLENEALRKVIWDKGIKFGIKELRDFHRSSSVVMKSNSEGHVRLSMVLG